MIGITVVPLHSLTVLLLLQTLFGIATAMLLYGWLRAGLKASIGVATATATLFALDPSQLFYERMVMAESTGFVALAAFFVTACLYVRTGLVRWMSTAVMLGMLAVSMRLSVLPVMLLFGVLAPGVRSFLGVVHRLERLANGG